MAVKKKSKAELLNEQIAEAVGAGRAVSVETVDFSDPNRPKTCLEVDFPILPVNQVAVIEGNAGKPIYQMSKWWARRRSSVFRSMLLAAAMKAPDDPAEAAKAVWDVYYANHQKKGALSHLKVADIFMGGGTTLVEGSRLGMQMYGNDLNPVAWLVVKNELADVDKAEVERLLAEIEAEVKPQIMPYYACDCPRGHTGKWISVTSGEVMGESFDPLALSPEERKAYRYEGPEVIYTFWAKHGPCQVTGCGHRTPIMSNPVVAVKTLTVKAWADQTCKCGTVFDLEKQEARMAPNASLVVAPDEKPYAIMSPEGQYHCPNCDQAYTDYLAAIQGHSQDLSKAKNKKVELTLLVHPQWLKGAPGKDRDGNEYGGRAGDSPESTAAWNNLRAEQLKLIEVRGKLPDEITCPETGMTLETGIKGGTVPTKITGSGNLTSKNGKLTCGECGIEQTQVDIIEKSKNTAPTAIFSIQGYCSFCDEQRFPYSGRFFNSVNPQKLNDADKLWQILKDNSLSDYWPKSELPFGHMTHQRQPLPQHGYTHWWKMFNSRQLLNNALILKTLLSKGEYTWAIREFVLGAFQQYLRNQNMFCFWNPQRDTPEPMFSNNNYHPKSTVIENAVFSDLGRGNWASCIKASLNGLDWSNNSWEIVSNQYVTEVKPILADSLSGKSEKIYPQDPVIPQSNISCGSSTELDQITDGSLDLVITDPPFGGLLHYSELSDFFYVWLRLALKDRYPDVFSGEYTPKTLEAVSNKARQPDDPDGFYQKVLTECWKEAYRMLKPAGILAFTFHHSEDEPWINVLESLFNAGYYLEATFPIRSDESKGDSGQFGSKKIEYDIVHVCRKRLDDPKSVSWARMRREVMRDIQQIQGVLENHSNAGLFEADLQVIKRGKALEYFSKHYGKVFVEEGVPMTVKEALVGINQLLDDSLYTEHAPPPADAEPFTRQFLRLFGSLTEQPRDQLQKFLRGTGMAPSDFIERGWCAEKGKIFYAKSAQALAQNWVGQHRHKMRDYDQLMFLVGACFDGSGINVSDTLNNSNFKPHPSLKALLNWMLNNGPDSDTRGAAQRAAQLYENWEKRNPTVVKEQMSFLDQLEV